MPEAYVMWPGREPERQVCGRARRRPGAPATRPAAGFTLIEILVVVLIIGIITAGIMLSVDLTGRDRDLEKESERLVSLVDYAREQAALQTREFGLLFHDDGYQFVTYDPRRGLWREVYEDESLRQRRLPAGLQFALTVESHPVVLVPTGDAKPDKKPAQKPNAMTIDQLAAQQGLSGSLGSSTSALAGASSSGLAGASTSGLGSTAAGGTLGSSFGSNGLASGTAGSLGSSGSSSLGSSFNNSGASGGGLSNGSASNGLSLDDVKPVSPQVLIYSNGDLTNFQLLMQRDGGVHSITLTQDDKGQLIAKPMIMLEHKS